MHELGVQALPAAQWEQAEPGGEAKLGLTQAVEHCVVDVALVPAGQAVHAERPADAAIVPAAQGVHEVLVQALPASQNVHWV